MFTTAPLVGHFFSLVPLAWACRALGHEVVVTTSSNFVPVVLRSGLPAVSCGPPADFVALLEHGTADLPVTARRYAHGLVFARIAAWNLSGVTAVVDAWRPDLVVAERAEHSGPIVAAARGIPHVEMQWGVPALAEFRAAAADALAPDLGRLGLAGLPVPDVVVNPWPPSLRLAHAVDQLSVRHVPYNGDALARNWMLTGADRPRVCLTLGTVLPRMAGEGVTDLMWPLLTSLAELDMELVVATDDETAATVRRLSPAIAHAGRLPLWQVLQTCAGVIHHGGNGTALTALTAGIPQLVLPSFDDQLENADAIAGAGAGVRVAHEMSPAAAIAQRCFEVINDAGFATAATRVAAEIAAQPSPVDVVRMLEHLVAAPTRSDDVAA